ncbi:MAG: transposase [Chitinophagales bacterium]
METKDTTSAKVIELYILKACTSMIRYSPCSQLSIQGFETPFEQHLNGQNRWIKLATAIPWDQMAALYYKRLSAHQGAPCVDARQVIAAMIIKHQLGLDDRGTIELIQENVYLQYFAGLSSFTTQPLFDPSLFVTLRKRMGADLFDRFNQYIICKAQGKPLPVADAEDQAASGGVDVDCNDTAADHTTNKAVKQPVQNPPDHPACNDISTPDEKNKTGSGDTQQSSADDNKPVTNTCSLNNKGKLMLDATVAPQQILYPTDLDLVNRSREESERLIDELTSHLALKKKPRTYRRNARKQYLNVAKKKNKTKKQLRRAIKGGLQYLRRNLNSIDQLLDKTAEQPGPLSFRDLKIMWVIRLIYEQQQQMYKDGTHSVPHRIVNIYQPHVRPIVRGKAAAHTEFGAKLDVSLSNGYARLDQISWEAYNESTHLKMQVENYHRLHGYYPEAMICDGIYGTRDNRTWLSQRNIRFVGKPLGRPSKESLTAYQKQKQKRERASRNQIEGKFGQGKQGYGLDNIRARLQPTSESWIACIFFVMNLQRFIALLLKNLLNSLADLHQWLLKRDEKIFLLPHPINLYPAGYKNYFC